MSLLDRPINSFFYLKYIYPQINSIYYFSPERQVIISSGQIQIQFLPHLQCRHYNISYILCFTLNIIVSLHQNLTY